MSSFKSRGCVSLLALVAGLYVPFGQADAEDDASTLKLGNVVVTAEKRETNIQDTPVSITAITAETLEAEGVRSIEDIAGFTPGLVVGGNAGFQFPISIRGISAAPNGIGSDSPAAIYVDGVYLGRPTSAVFDMVDLERIEVLRGPQGTLYGRNAVGGAINITSKKPSDELEVFGSASFSDLEESRTQASISGPISDTVGYRLSASYRNTGDWLDNTDGRRVGGGNGLALRGALDFELGDNLNLIVRGDYTDIDDPYYSKRIELLGTVLPVASNYDTMTDNEVSFSKREMWGVSAEANLDIGDLSLISISAYRESFSRTQIGSDGIIDRVLRSGSAPGEGEDQNQFSQELRLVSPGGEKVDWILGGYYFTETGNFDLNIENYGAGVSIDFSPYTTTDNFAAFGQADIHLTDALSLTAGLRYSWEKKDFTFRSQVVPLTVNADVNIPVTSVPNSTAAIALDDDDTWSSWTPKIGLNYDLSEDVLLYGSYSQGFKSGGFNSIGSDPAYDPEKVSAWEVGMKSDLAGGRVRLNASAFYYDYTDLQVRVPIAVGVIQVQNAANAEIYGGEIELQAIPVDNMLVTAGLALNHARYKDYLQTPVTECPGGAYDAVTSTCDLSGNALNRAPDTTFSLTALYDFELANGATVTPRLSYQYEGKSYYTEQNLPYQGHNGWESLGARLTYATADDGLNLSLFARNITDDRYYAHSLPIGTAFTITTGPNRPRTFGIELSVRR